MVEEGLKYPVMAVVKEAHMFKDIDHVTIIVKDLEGAIAQYKAILGTDKVRYSERRLGATYQAAHFDFASTNIEIITPTDEHNPWGRRLAQGGDGLYLVSLQVDNLRQTVERLRGQGVRLVGDPGPGTGPITNLVCVHPKSANGVMLLLSER